jgi:hypothetical protein
MQTPISSRSSVPRSDNACTADPTSPRKMQLRRAIVSANATSGSLLLETLTRAKG